MNKTPVFFLLGVLCSSTLATADTASDVDVITRAECTEAGLRLRFKNDARIDIPTSEERHSNCQELKVSDDGKAAAWVIACAGEMLNGDGEGKEADGSTYQAVCASLSGAEAGKAFDIVEISAVVDHVSFEARTHRLTYYTAPMHGGGAYFLYDLDARKDILACGDDDTSPDCVDLAIRMGLSQP